MHRADETGIAVQQEKPDFKTELADIQISSLPDSMLYRLENLRIAQEYYQARLEHFRREEKMSRVRDKIREYAEKNGMSEQDVIAGINKDTDMNLSEISQVFNEAYENSPAVKTAKEKMDHALNDWKDSYSSLTEDFGYGDTDNRDYRRAFGQYENSREDMEEATASVTKTLGEVQTISNSFLRDGRSIRLTPLPLDKTPMKTTRRQIAGGRYKKPAANLYWQSFFNR